MQEQRKNTRYRSTAHARIPGLFEGDALLKDLSVTGCCIECTMHIEPQPHTQYVVQICPEESAKIGDFELLVESRWIRAGTDCCVIGFMVQKSPMGKLFQRYVDYLAWRTSASNTSNP